MSTAVLGHGPVGSDTVTLWDRLETVKSRMTDYCVRTIQVNYLCNITWPLQIVRVADETKCYQNIWSHPD